MAKNLNHHLYQYPATGVWYFQKKVRGLAKPYKLSLETKSAVDVRRKRDELLKQIQTHGRIPKEEPIAVSENRPFGEVAQRWSEFWMVSGSLFSFCCFSPGYALEKRPG